MRHLGPRVATLVDGQMPVSEEERAWAHVHACPLCAEAVQREGWIKRQLAGLSFSATDPLPDELVGSLRDPAGLVDQAGDTEPPLDLLDDGPSRPRRLAGIAVLGAGSVSAAMMGVVALGAAPANAPGFDRVPAVITQPVAAQGAGSRPRAARPTRPDLDTTEVDAAAVARQVASTVLVGMRLGR